MKQGTDCAALAVLVAALLGMACSETPRGEGSGDFAVLARSEPGYLEARPGHVLRFPGDHGPHPGYRIEWWYLTANLEDAAGRPYGAQWTLFRTATEPPGAADPANPWQDAEVWMAHFAITTPGDHVAFQRYARGGAFGGGPGTADGAIARAGAQAEPFAAWLDDWSLRSLGDGWLPLRLEAAQHPHAVRLRLDSDQPLVLQGNAGYSQKHPAGGGSHYYSQPFLQADGELVVKGTVVPVTGLAWLDREWSSQFLRSDQQGWDWFALHLESGEKLMMFRLRARDDPAADYVHGVLIGADGGKVPLDPARISLDVLETVTVAGRQLPLRWRIRIPEIGRDLVVEALHPDQWMDVDFAYWEGVVVVRGDNPGTRGRGYLELTGYPAK